MRILMKSGRRYLTLLLCSALVASRLLGVHLHVGHSEDEGASTAQHVHEHELVVTSEFEADHGIAHGDAGAVDLSASHIGSGKLPLLTTLALLCSALALLAFPFAGRHEPPVNYRVPIPPGRIRLLPPSQAPPLPA